MDRQLPDLYSVSPDQIGEVIDDLRLIQQDNARIYYAVDPYEVGRFCFPVDPTQEAGRTDIKTVADDQAALFEVFYTHKQRPLLLSEYSNEMGRMLTYFEMTAEELTKSDMVDRLIEEGRLDIPDDNGDAQAAFLRENFNIILAIAMGIFSLGLARLQNVYHTRLIRGDLEDSVSQHERAVVKRIARSYQRSNHWEVILKQLRRPRWELGENQEEPPSRADEIDASAIDRVIFLNSAFEKAHLDGELDSRYLILYLSAAPKTIRLFTRSSANRFLPSISGRPYNFWRTRAQIFAYVVHKSKDGDLSESIANLERVRDVLDEIRKFEGLFSSEDCNDCALKPGTPIATAAHQPTCRWSEFCEKVKGLDDEIQRARQEVQNLGLINTLSDYERLRSAKPQGESQRQYFDYFKVAFDSPLTRDARMKMQRLQRWILVKSEFTNSFTEALGVGKSGLDQSALRTGKDFVTNLDQYLPTKPKLTSQTYKRILDSTLQFYRDPTKVELIEEAYKRYVELDTESRGIGLEHELIRCFLYLALPRTPENMRKAPAHRGGDEKAYLHAEAIMAGEELLDREEWNIAPEAMKQEYRYVQCWAARRIAKFSRAVELAKKGIELGPDDPRFFHGLCLSVYSWLTKTPDDSAPKLDEAIEAAGTAIKLYLNAAKDRENDEVVAANYNNLAYFWAWSVEMNQPETPADRETALAKSQQALACARDALDHLKKFINKDDWESTKHPEFFHTEAYLEYQESTVAISEGDRIRALDKLRNAKREIDKAVRLFEEGPGHEEYRALRDRIERALEMLNRM